MADLTDKDRWELQRLMEKDPKAAFAFYERKLAEPAVLPPIELPPPKPFAPLTLNTPLGGWALSEEVDVVMLSARELPSALSAGKSPFVIARHGRSPTNAERLPGDPAILIDEAFDIPKDKTYGSCAAASLKMLLDWIGRQDRRGEPLLMIGGDGSAMTNAAVGAINRWVRETTEAPSATEPRWSGGDVVFETTVAAEPEETPCHERNIAELMRTGFQDL